MLSPRPRPLARASPRRSVGGLLALLRCADCGLLGGAGRYGDSPPYGEDADEGGGEDGDREDPWCVQAPRLGF